jgi:hypothetical protein
VQGVDAGVGAFMRGHAEQLLTLIKLQRANLDKLAFHTRDTMDSVNAMIRRAERDAAIILALRDVRATLRVVQAARVGIDVRSDIEKVAGVLTLLGSTD